ncbi:MAG: excinuclease ABC subunit UvrC [Candidatus Omnitrophota bacterium]
MKGADNAVIYVGKAVSLRKRVQSYFHLSKKELSKTSRLVKEICDIDYLPTASEAEALILEASLIKEYQPKYNVDLRDDKSYPFIEITKEKFPKISVVRPNTKKKALESFGPRKPGRYFGPYVDASLIRQALTIIRRIFHFRTCEPFPKKACLDYHIGLCDAPCIKNISEQDYAKNIHKVSLVLEGKKDELSRQLRAEMEALAKEKEFEAAAVVRDQIRSIGALYSGTKDVNYYKEIDQLQRVLQLSRRPERIEAFDISNTMGRQAVGSMVSFLDGKPDKRNYRRFKIREVKGIDDFKMIAEIVRRRYRRLKEERLKFPDLILIDGGKGQLFAALEELHKLSINIPLASIAKREEELFLPGKRESIKLPKDSLALQLIQRIRDEAHRFAINYHRLLRARKALNEER